MCGYTAAADFIQKNKGEKKNAIKNLNLNIQNKKGTNSLLKKRIKMFSHEQEGRRRRSYKKNHTVSQVFLTL